jgi:hypothetical protein
MDMDPGGPKTYGSYGSGSETLTHRLSQSKKELEIQKKNYLKNWSGSGFKKSCQKFWFGEVAGSLAQLLAYSSELLEAAVCVARIASVSRWYDLEGHLILLSCFQ